MESKIIAMAGKGGVGKTSLAASMVKVLVSAFPDKKILAIDADPAVGLSTALGAEDGDTKTAVELLGEARYRIMDALVEQDGYSFIAIGRPEAAGCYCKINTYLKEVIRILSSNFDYIVIDGEAGIEQINRRVMEKVTHLVLITDTSRKGTQVVQTIRKVADELVMYEQAGVIINRVPDESIVQYMDLGDLPVLSVIPSDSSLAEFDLKGENVFYLSDDAAIVRGAREALKKLEIL